MSRVVCEHCGATFDADDVPITTIPSATLFQCPSCGRWTEDPPPEMDK